MKRATLFISFAIFSTGACASISRPDPDVVTPQAWGALLTTTDSLVAAERHAAADSALLAFERAHPGTRAATEVLFWRALYKLDPRSSPSTRAEGRVLMESYAAAPGPLWYRGQANVLRHLAREIAAGSPAGGDASIVPGDSSARGLAARDEVIRTQRAEIARLNAELERIKRRLAAPTP